MASSETESVTANPETAEEGSWWSSWGKSIVDTVKEKTSSTYEMVHKDLSEFYQTIQTDTATVVVETATLVQDQIKVKDGESEEGATSQGSFKHGITSLLSTVSESLKTLALEEAPYPDKTTASEASLSSPVYNRREAKIRSIQTEVSTYCNEPDGPTDTFTDWQESFDFDAKRSEMSDLLVKVPEIRAIYSKLVPSVVSHGTFWQRYFYKIHQFEMGEERRAALVARAETSSLHEDEYNWDSDDGEDIVEIQPKPTNEENVITVQVHSEPKPVKELTDESKPDELKKAEIETRMEVAETTKADELKDDKSFEILSPIKESETIESQSTEKVSEDRENERKISDSMNSKTNRDDNVHEAPKDTEVDPEHQSSRSSYCREDSSSGSSVEVIQRVSDASTRQLSSDNEKDIGLGRLNTNHRLLETKVTEDSRVDHSETASTGSWISVDDEFRVKKSKKEKFINGKGSDTELTKSPESNRNSGSSSSSAVLVEKSECKALDDDDNDDVDIDLDEDINEEELKKIMDKIKNKSGDIDDDDDWEDWE
eukprot:Seg2837.3 transcript_id=Seg2837.3/GoldUCD/mRNA.D3Y31 product="BSD domain-containing protein 1" protein_id=Seg2837.3/GoldUCD/D3Y31